MISQERCRILLPGGGVCISLNDVQTERMQIGFIGAGKVGVSLGKYFKEKGRNVGGYYSLTRASAAWAAAFTQTTCYESLEEIISSCGMILFTVPDSAIAEVWQQAKPYVSGKVIGHCSGLYSSDIFSDWDSMNVMHVPYILLLQSAAKKMHGENYPAYCSHSRGTPPM